MRFSSYCADVMPILVVGSFGLALLSAGSCCQAGTFSGNGTLTTDYVWRGTTQTQGDPAVQAGLKFSGDSGFYGSVWGSNVKFGPEVGAHTELDFTVGWGKDLTEDWALDVNVLHYRYPGAKTDLDWTELNGTITYARNYWLSVGYSPEALASDESGIYTQIGARIPFDDRFRLEAAVGYYALNDVYGESYVHGQLSAIWTLKAPVELRITAHATDSGAKTIFGDSYAGSRIEAALQASF